MFIFSLCFGVRSVLIFPKQGLSAWFFNFSLSYIFSETTQILLPRKNLPFNSLVSQNHIFHYISYSSKEAIFTHSTISSLNSLKSRFYHSILKFSIECCRYSPLQLWNEKKNFPLREWTIVVETICHSVSILTFFNNKNLSQRYIQQSPS